LAAFAKPEVAEAINGMVDQLLAVPGAEDVTARLRGSGRLVKEGRCAWLLPTIVRVDSYDHPLANKEFLFPFASVVECSQSEVLRRIGPTLAAMVLTDDEAFIRQVLDCPLIERLNLGPIPTNRLTWDQPMKGTSLPTVSTTSAATSSQASCTGLTISRWGA
jgi:acyl-CoA reductase-like NAD-dependent aldehyde dehydrogenase